MRCMKVWHDFIWSVLTCTQVKLGYVERGQEENKDYLLSTSRHYLFAESQNGMALFFSFKELHIYLLSRHAHTKLNKTAILYRRVLCTRKGRTFTTMTTLLRKYYLKKNASGTRKLCLSRYHILSLAILNKRGRCRAKVIVPRKVIVGRGSAHKLLKLQHPVGIP